jgi:hypothetical protein
MRGHSVEARWVKIKNRAAVTREAKRIGCEGRRTCCACAMPALRPQKPLEQQRLGRFRHTARSAHSKFCKAATLQEMRKRKCPRQPDRQGPAYRPPFARLDDRSPLCAALARHASSLVGRVGVGGRAFLRRAILNARVHERALHSSATIANAKPAEQGRARAGNGTRALDRV